MSFQIISSLTRNAVPIFGALLIVRRIAAVSRGRLSGEISARFMDMLLRGIRHNCSAVEQSVEYS